MRNLVVFLARNYFFLLFLLLELLSVYFLVQHNYFQHASAVSASNTFTGTIYEWRTDMTSYFNLKEQNLQLNERLALMMNKDSTSGMMYTTNTNPVNDTIYKQRFEYLAAEIVDNTVSARSNYIIVNRGSLQGVAKGMGVICSNGIVGIVREVSGNFCVVMSVLHKDSHISTSVKRDGTFGQLLWDGLDYRQGTLIDLPTHSKLKIGDTLVTSGLGDAFPQGVAVGTVLHFEKKAGDKTFTADVQFTTDFRKIHHVLIVKNLVRYEIDELRKKAGIENGN
jgi:rod shape-determining protein MreC